MVRDGRLILFPMVIIILFLISFFFFRGSYHPEPKPWPDSTSQSDIEETGPQPQWYVRFSVENQKLTFYTEHALAPASASARGYFLGSGAVHPRYPLNEGGEARQPIIPFGTVLFLNQPIEIQGNWYDSLIVNDTGDVYYGLWRKYPYWVDVYFGTTNYYTQKAALEAGVDLINYHWYEPWK